MCYNILYMAYRTTIQNKTRYFDTDDSRHVTGKGGERIRPKEKRIYGEQVALTRRRLRLLALALLCSTIINLSVSLPSTSVHQGIYLSFYVLPLRLARMARQLHLPSISSLLHDKTLSTKKGLKASNYPYFASFHCTYIR